MKKLKIGDIILFEPYTTEEIYRGTIIDINTVDDIQVAEIKYDLLGSIQGIGHCKRPLSDLVPFIEPICVAPSVISN